MRNTGYPLLMLTIILLTACHNPSKDQDGKQEASKPERKTNHHQYGIDTGQKIPKGLKTGTKAPNFSSITQQGKSIALSQLKDRQPVVLMFYRGQWCPVCNQYLKRFEDSLKQVQKAGGKVIAVTPETAPNVKEMRQKTGTSITIVPDTSETIMNKYKVTFGVTSDYAKKIKKGFNTSIAENNDDQKARLPVPATYIIDKDGHIAWRFFNPNYKQRASVKAIVKQLRQLKQ